MQQVAIYGIKNGLEEAYKRLEQSAQKNKFKFEVQGSARNWTRIELKEKKLFGGGLHITLNARRLDDPQDDFAQHIRGLIGFVHQIETPHEHARLQLMNEARAVNCAVSITTEKIDTVLEIVQLLTVMLDGFALYGGAFFANAAGETILAIDGSSELAPPVIHPDQTLRKQRSESILQAQDVPFLASLPVVSSEQSVVARSPLEIAQRALGIAIVAVKGETNDPELSQKLIGQFRANAFFTPKERKFLLLHSVPESGRAQFSWQYECVWVLLWALGYLESLAKPVAICDVPMAMGILRETGSAEALAQAARPRSVAEILDETDLIYRYHWACVSARLKGQPAPGGLEAGVVMERHRALNWLTGYLGQDWDDVSTDT